MTRLCAVGSVVLQSLALVALSPYIVQPTDGSNILGVFLSPFPSHLITHMSVIKALAEKGHNITSVSLMKPKVNHENIKNIIIPPLEKYRSKYEAVMAQLTSGEMSILQLVASQATSNRIFMDIQFDALLDERFTALYENKDNKFDVVILGLFMSDFKLAIGAKFKCPIIVSWMNQPMEIVDDLVGNPTEISYVPNQQTPVKPGEQMNFPTRVKSYFLVKFFKVIRLLLDRAMKGYYNKFIEMDPTLPPYEAMKRNISLMFCNSHYSEGLIRPLVPATILIGGIQIKEKPDQLPKNIEDFLTASHKNGAILFSLGTNIRDSHVKPETRKIFYKVLSSLKQNVVWKWEDLENTPGNASNIFYQKWLPQDDILAHPNLKLFITHAGKGGLMEATYHGVPMLAMPMFVDQPANAHKMVLAGHGVQLDIKLLTETIFRNAIEEVLNNSSYANAVKAFANLYRDRPLTAKESVVYWTEYVIRHRGAPYLQSPVVHMNYLQSSSLDVHLLIVGTLYAIYKLLKLIIRLVRNKLFTFTANKSTKTKKLKKK